MRSPRVILHLDLDAFFAAVEQRDRPELRGQPVIVGGGGPSDRGVVSAASYEARRFGIRSAMPLRTAAALCPQAVFLPVDGRRYATASREVMSILRRFTPRLEQLSIDEAFLDVTGTQALFGSGPQIAARIKDAIRTEVRLSASVGVASNRLLAKIASDLHKPDGLVVVPAGEEARFLAPLPVERLWGVGPSTYRALAEYGVTTIGDLAALPDDLLSRRFGRHGRQLAERARGVDDSQVAVEGAAKSISQEHTFAVDTTHLEQLESTLLALSEGVAGRLRAAGLRCSTVAVKIRDSDFATITRQRALPEPTDLTDDIWRAAVELARRELHGMPVRLLGVAASGLSGREQLQLFGSENDRLRRAIAAADAIRRRYGPAAIRRARLIDTGAHDPRRRGPR